MDEKSPASQVSERTAAGCHVFANEPDIVFADEPTGALNQIPRCARLVYPPESEGDHRDGDPPEGHLAGGRIVYCRRRIQVS